MSKIEIINFINIFTVVNLTVLFLLFWLRKNNVKANKVLALIIFIPVFAFLNNLLVYHKTIYDYYLLNFSDTITFLWGPFVLWYVMLLLGRGNKLRPIHILHLVPFFLVFIAKAVILFNPNYRTQFFDILIETNGMEPTIYLLLSILLLIHILGYLFVSLYEVKKYHKLQYLIFSSEDKLKTRWLFELIILLLLLDFTQISAYAFLDLDPIIIDLIASPMICNVFYLLIVYKTFFHSAVFTIESYNTYIEKVKPMLIYDEEGVFLEKTLVYSTLDKKKYDEYANTIVHYFKTEKPYLNPNLTVIKLSELINIPAHYISATLNQKLNTTFLDYVNHHRVEQVKLKLLEKQHLKFSIEAIGYECGFNSKATFFRVFKKLTKKTPLEFSRD